MAEPTLPLTGAQFDIAAGDYQATVTELGAGLRMLTHQDRPVIAGYEADQVPPAGAGQLLLPWPNRVDHGRYSFGGGSYQLDLSEPAHDNAIHGLTRFASWSLVARADDEVELGLRLLGRPGYPFCLELRATLPADSRSTGSRSPSRRATRATGPHPTAPDRTPTCGPAPSSSITGTCSCRPTRWQPADDRGIPAGRAAGRRRARRMTSASAARSAPSRSTTRSPG